MTRDQMAQAILDLVAGQDPELAFHAQADALATGLGGTAKLSGFALEEALEYLDDLHESMREHVQQNWGDIRNMPRQ